MIFFYQFIKGVSYENMQRKMRNYFLEVQQRTVENDVNYINCCYCFYGAIYFKSLLALF